MVRKKWQNLADCGGEIDNSAENRALVRKQALILSDRGK